MKIEWVCKDRLCNQENVLSGIDTPVVRLAEVDAVIQEVVEIMQACYAVGEIRFKTCVLSAQVSDQIQVFLTGQVVAKWRERQKKEGA